MKRKRLSGEEKLAVVLEGMRLDTTLAEVCNRHQISQATYYKWRDRLFAASDVIYADRTFSRSEERLKAENKKLREIIGDLTVELKKKLLQ